MRAGLGAGQRTIWTAPLPYPGHTPLAALAPLSPGERGKLMFGAGMIRGGGCFAGRGRFQTCPYAHL